MTKKNQLSEECVYCGEDTVLTQDEVIPRCIFASPLPSNLIKVLACAKCNNEEKSKDDAFLRDLVLSDVNAMKNESAKALFDSKVVRSINTHRSEFARQAVPTAKLLPIHTDGGIYLGHAYQLTVNRERVGGIFSRIASAIYYWKTQNKVPPNCDVSVEQISPEQFIEDNKLFMGYAPYIHESGTEFTLITYCSPTNDNFYALFWLIFYERVCWFVGINAPQTNP